MGYELEKNESVAEGARRIWSEEVTAAIATLENIGENREKAVHEVRKSIKKIRAIMRLVRRSMGKEVFKQENIRYRNIGHMLSSLRDATVMIKTLNKLNQADKNAIPRAALRNARKALLNSQAAVSRSFFEEKQSINEVLAALNQAKEQLPQLSAKQNSFAVYAVNMHPIYERGKNAYVHVSKEPSIEGFHELRKEVKILWYHTRILKPIWPGYMEAYDSQLGILSELLGDDHDMGVLFEEIQSGRLSFGRKSTVDKVLNLIDKQRSNLQQQIYPLAKRLFAEEAEAYIRRLKLYWNIWRNEDVPLQVT